MKKIQVLSLVAALAVAFSFSACNSDSVESATLGSSDTDSISYAIGVLIGQNVPKDFYTDINYALVAKAIKDVRDSSTVLTVEDAQSFMQRYGDKQNETRYAANVQEGEDYLAANGQKEGVITTASGLQYEVLEEGTGPKPTAGDVVKTNYVGKFIDGEIFDQNDGIEFPLNGVIRGWTEGIQLMAVGSKYRFHIPYELAYGERGYQGAIEPYKTLVFEVELLDINPPKAQGGAQ